MRAITFGLLMITTTGCYASHLGDASARDGGVTDARAPIDAPADAPDGALDAQPSCDLPIAEWAQTEQRYEGEYVESAARLRDGERTWIAADSVDGALTLVALDETRPVPALMSTTPLVMRARPIAGAMDSVRIAITYLDASGETRVGVFDPSGAGLSDSAWMGDAARATMAIRGARVGVAVAGSAPRVAVLDATGGAPFLEGSFADAIDVSVGLGRGLFAAVATTASGESRYWGIDERGTIDAGGIGARLSLMEWDGMSVIGWDDTTNEVVVRASGGRLIRRGSTEEGMPAIGPSLAMRGGEAWIALSYGGGSVRFEDGEGARHERVIDGSITALMAHASRRHRGAFVLDETARQLVWIGWSCDPDR